MEQVIFLLGRILFGGYFIMNGYNHLKNLQAMAGYAGSKNVPSPKAAVTISGLMILLGGLGIVLGAYVELSLWLIAIFLIVVSPMMHNFWAVSTEQKQMEYINFMKNMALLGATLMMLSLPEIWMWTLAL